MNEREKNILNFGFNKKSEAWQRTAIPGNKFVMKGNYDEVVWGEILSEEDFNNRISDKLRNTLLNSFDILNADKQNIRMVQLNAGHTTAPIITIIPVSIIEAFVPERVYEYAKKQMWPINPNRFLDIMYPLAPIYISEKILIN